MNNFEHIKRMTEKQMIIDGVDVSGCEYRSIIGVNVCTFYRHCAKTYCPYKFSWLKEQLKRKEQECEELKEELIEIRWKIEAQDIELNDNVEQLDLLKAENEELKEKLQKYKDKEQKEVELKKQCADSFKEMQKRLYEKFEGNSLIEKRNPYEN